MWVFVFGVWMECEVINRRRWSWFSIARSVTSFLDSEADKYIFIIIFFFYFLEKAPQLEETPKWQALKQVLDEIDGEIKQMVSSGDLKNAEDCRVLVCAEDDSTCSQLKEV
jgi:hypothetical protein